MALSLDTAAARLNQPAPIPAGQLAIDDGPRIGSVCTGYAGLDLAVRDVFGGTTAWHADIDPGASKILAHHYPDVPNLGDISTVDWTTVEPVDILTAGFPCQDVSLAGRRAGFAEGTRSGLWRQVARAIRELRPRLVVIENVRGLLSADAHGNLEPCPWCLGDAGGEPVLRALGAVLGDLAALGFDAEWQVLRASDIGAPHQRERVFVLARPAHAEGEGFQGSYPLRGRVAGGRAVAADAGDLRGDRRAARPGQARREVAAGHAAADTDRDALREQSISEPGCRGASVPGQPGADLAAHAGRLGRGQGIADVQPGQPDAQGCAPADADGGGRWSGAGVVGGVRAEERVEGDSPERDWGAYAPAIRRWEHATGRRAPWATDDRNRLSPAFVEWLMGLPAGHVTGVPGLTRTAQLKALGNGVVPQQAAAALRHLAARTAA